MILKGNCLETLKTLPDCSVDSIVTDPPYELGFMGKSWDNSGIAYSKDLWAECLRVLKPGGHLLAFSGSRTYHRMVVAIEDSGFEIRDQIMWIYGSGFPKSLDVSKAMDKAAGAERPREIPRTLKNQSTSLSPSGFNVDGWSPQTKDAQTPEAQQWQGWGTALKPAHEPICVARKPLIGTVANNVLTYGTGALNIDGSRVGDEIVEAGNAGRGSGHNDGTYKLGFGVSEEKQTSQGRWPANVIHDGSDEVLAGFPNSKSATGAFTITNSGNATWNQSDKGMFDAGKSRTFEGYGDSGSAARFFYCAKASKSERNAGLEGLPERNLSDRGEDGMRDKNSIVTRHTITQNFHPTVKPLALMRYLVKLVTPPNGTVLDPFLGSGSTAVAAILEGFEWIGCEMTEDYFPIIEARVEWAMNQPKPMV
jgi:site-specific DNA-methyltransferase (adenine-specific)